MISETTTNLYPGECKLKTETEPFKDSIDTSALQKYIGCHAGTLRADKIAIHNHVPNAAILRADFSFQWKEITTIHNPNQHNYAQNCTHASTAITEEQTDWQKESGNLIAVCQQCGWQGNTHLWGHPLHQTKGSLQYCKLCYVKD